DGKRTSSGEVYEQDDLTAAHYDWAFGTRLRVTLLATDRSVVVRINDRFPPYKGRLIDLSRGAARAIGLIGPGTGEVRVEVIEELASRPDDDGHAGHEPPRSIGFGQAAA